jgi:hypothetical protein
MVVLVTAKHSLFCNLLLLPSVSPVLPLFSSSFFLPLIFPLFLFSLVDMISRPYSASTLHHLRSANRHDLFLFLSSGRLRLNLDLLLRLVPLSGMHFLLIFGLKSFLAVYLPPYLKTSLFSRGLAHRNRF